MNTKISFALIAIAVLLAPTFAADSGEAVRPKPALTWVWYPNESVPEYAQVRRELLRVVSEALGREIKEQTTTDYAIAIEAVVNNNAAFSWFGGEGYTQAHAKNPKVLPLVTNSPTNTLDTAKYYSMIAVLKENAPKYMVDGKYDLSLVKQKKFSFVSNSSTSGFRVPSSVLARQFGVDSQDLLEGGKDKVFAEVMFGGSHQGSMFNVLSGKAEVGVFCNECVRIYTDWMSDAAYQDPKVGDIVTIKAKADAPFDQFPGREMVLIASVPVLNAPIVMNTGLLTDQEIAALKAALTSEATTNNQIIFPPKGSAVKSMFTTGHRFLPVEDKWYDPIRQLSGLK